MSRNFSRYDDLSITYSAKIKAVSGCQVLKKADTEEAKQHIVEIEAA